MFMKGGGENVEMSQGEAGSQSSHLRILEEIVLCLLVFGRS